MSMNVSKAASQNHRSDNAGSILTYTPKTEKTETVTSFVSQSFGSQFPSRHSFVWLVQHTTISPQGELAPF